MYRIITGKQVDTPPTVSTDEQGRVTEESGESSGSETTTDTTVNVETTNPDGKTEIEVTPGEEEKVGEEAGKFEPDEDSKNPKPSPSEMPVDNNLVDQPDININLKPGDQKKPGSASVEDTTRLEDELKNIVLEKIEPTVPARPEAGEKVETDPEGNQVTVVTKVEGSEEDPNNYKVTIENKSEQDGEQIVISKTEQEVKVGADGGYEVITIESKITDGQDGGQVEVPVSQTVIKVEAQKDKDDRITGYKTTETTITFSADGEKSTTEKVTESKLIEEIDKETQKKKFKVETTTTTTYPSVSVETGTNPTGVPENADIVASMPEISGDDVIFVLPEKPEEKDETDSNGNRVTVSVGNIYNKDYEIIGYDVVTTVFKDGEVISRTNESKWGTITKSEEIINLPEEPKEDDFVNEEGNHVSIRVENILNDGKIVGYNIITIVRDEAGNELSRNSESIWGTKTETQITLNTDATITTWQEVKITTTTPITQGVTESSVWVETTERTAWASMSNVMDNSKNNFKPTQIIIDQNLSIGNDKYDGQFYDSTHELYGRNEFNKLLEGTVKETYNIRNKPSTDGKTIIWGTLLEGVKVYIYETSADGNWYRIGPSAWINKKGVDAVSKDQEYQYKFTENGSYEYYYAGESGLESSIRVKKENGGNTWRAHQFILKDAQENKYYTYCADLETDAKAGYGYNTEAIENADYYKNAESNEKAAEHIRAIALNGFWGTEEGTGSLEDLKKKLVASNRFSKEEVATLTEGEALTATQAAIWHFGNSGKSEIDINNMDRWLKYYGQYYNTTDKKVEDNWSHLSKEEKNRVSGIYNWLIGLDPEPDPKASLLSKDNFATEANITVKEKNDVVVGEYFADVAITMSVEPSKINGDLIVEIKAGDKIIATQRLAGQSKENEKNWGRIEEVSPGSGNWKIVFDNLSLAAGDDQNITIQLSGTQNLGEGVYIFTSETKNGEQSQTFVGMTTTKDTRDVDISFNLSFDVTDAQAKFVSETTQKNSSKEDKVFYKRVDTKTERLQQSNITTITENESHREWANSWKNTYSYEDEIPEETPTPTSPEETPTPTPPEETPTPTPPEETPTPTPPGETPAPTPTPSGDPVPTPTPTSPVEDPEDPTPTPTPEEPETPPSEPEEPSDEPEIEVFFDEPEPQMDFGFEIVDEEVPLISFAVEEAAPLAVTVVAAEDLEVILDEDVPLAGEPELAVILDEEVPLAREPELTVILDEDVPLAGIEPELTDLFDEGVPLSGIPEEELVDLFDEDVPLADVPETGDISAVWYVLILLAGSCLAIMTVSDVKKKRKGTQRGLSR